MLWVERAGVAMSVREKGARESAVDRRKGGQRRLVVGSGCAVRLGRRRKRKRPSRHLGRRRRRRRGC